MKWGGTGVAHQKMSSFSVKASSSSRVDLDPDLLLDPDIEVDPDRILRRLDAHAWANRRRAPPAAAAAAAGPRIGRRLVGGSDRRWSGVKASPRLSLRPRRRAAWSFCGNDDAFSAVQLPLDDVARPAADAHRPQGRCAGPPPVRPTRRRSGRSASRRRDRGWRRRFRSGQSGRRRSRRRSTAPGCRKWKSSSAVISRSTPPGWPGPDASSAPVAVRAVRMMPGAGRLQTGILDFDRVRSEAYRHAAGKGSCRAQAAERQLPRHPPRGRRRAPSAPPSGSANREAIVNGSALNCPPAQANPRPETASRRPGWQPEDDFRRGRGRGRSAPSRR